MLEKIDETRRRNLYRGYLRLRVREAEVARGMVTDARWNFNEASPVAFLNSPSDPYFFSFTSRLFEILDDLASHPPLRPLSSPTPSGYASRSEISKVGRASNPRFQLIYEW